MASSDDITRTPVLKWRAPRILKTNGSAPTRPVPAAGTTAPPPKMIWRRQQDGSYTSLDPFDSASTWKISQKIIQGHWMWTLYRNSRQIFATGLLRQAKSVAANWRTTPRLPKPDRVGPRAEQSSRTKSVPPADAAPRYRLLWTRYRSSTGYTYTAIDEGTCWKICRTGRGPYTAWHVARNNEDVRIAPSLSVAKKWCEEQPPLPAAAPEVEPPVRTPQLRWPGLKGSAEPMHTPAQTYRYTLPRCAYQSLSPGQEIAITDCTEDAQKLRQRLYQWGRKSGRRYTVTERGSTTYIRCRESTAVDQWRPQRTRSRQLVAVDRRRTTPPNRTDWIRNAETGAYHCHDISPQARGRTAWELRPTEDPFWRWLVVRNGTPVAQSRTLADARAEAEQLK